MHTRDIAALRQMIAAGMTDDDIAEQCADDLEAADFAEAAYGYPDDRDEPSYDGSGRNRNCDSYYARNDAGEWIGLM